MKSTQIIYFAATLAAVFILTVVFLRILIPILKSKKIGQKILDIGPRWHKSKEGTPIMGGLAFIFAILAASAAISVAAAFRLEIKTLLPFYTTLLLALMNGAIGAFDDYTKLIKKRNEGLKASQKYLLQLAAAGIYLALTRILGLSGTTLRIPYFGVELELGFFYYIFALILITGVVNSVNLTDGIDGLASSVTAIVGAFFAVCAFAFSDLPLTFASACAIGATLGFLVYNFYPARIFMGDTGSLFLGGLICGCAFMMNDPLIIVVAGAIYIIEALSDIIQVFYFKLTHGKRLFKMAPIHHHFEKCGWSEIKIVAVFSAVTAIACVLAWFGVAK